MSNTQEHIDVVPKRLYMEVVADNQELAAQFQDVKFQLEQMKRMLFGKKSERTVLDDTQLSLDGFSGESSDEKAEKGEKQQIVITRSKPKKKPVRTEIPSHIPRRREVLAPEDIPEGSRKIGEVITEILEYQQPVLYVRQIVREKYALPQDAGLIIPNLPTVPLPKSIAGASLLAQLLTGKYIDHLPFYRQQSMISRLGVELHRPTMSNWFDGTCQLLTPLYDKFVESILSSNYLQGDESPIPVQDKDKKGTLHKGYMWVVRDPIKGLVLFKYDKSRGAKVPEDIFNNFMGALQTDGYAAYSNMNTKWDIILLACMTHARRKFEAALDNDAERARYVLALMQELYAIERHARENEFSFKQRYELRQEKAIPILDKIEKFLNENIGQTRPKSPIGKAIAYTLNLWSRLRSYVDGGEYEIDNNLIENAIRPLALGRKNYLFAGSHDAAQNAAMMYTLFATCKVNEINPYKWLTDVLNRIPNHPAKDLHQLFPTKEYKFFKE